MTRYDQYLNSEEEEKEKNQLRFNARFYQIGFWVMFAIFGFNLYQQYQANLTIESKDKTIVEPSTCLTESMVVRTKDGASLPINFTYFGGRDAKAVITYKIMLASSNVFYEDIMGKKERQAFVDKLIKLNESNIVNLNCTFEKVPE